MLIDLAVNAEVFTMSAIRPSTNIMLIDADAFFVSCERVFNPKLRARPVVVLSANDGVVIARSKEAKSLIPMGSPLFQYTEIICKYDIAALSSNFELYADQSRRLMGVLNQFSPRGVFR